MSQTVIYPEWRKEQEPTKYPFAERASLSNGSRSFLEGTFLDAAIYTIGMQARAYVSRVTVAHESVTVYVGDIDDPIRAHGTFSTTAPDDLIVLVDASDRPAGVLVSEANRLLVLGSWGVGTYVFSPEQTELVATVCFPQPAEGLRGVLLDDGTLLTGEIWLLGDDGVVLRSEQIETAPGVLTDVIRVDVVGDPLFRRRLCSPIDLFETPQLLKTITFTDGTLTKICGPGNNGSIQMTVNNNLAVDSILRIRTLGSELRIEAAGKSTAQRT